MGILKDMKIVHGDVPCKMFVAVIIVWLFKVKMSLSFQTPFNLNFLRRKNLDAAFHAVLDTKILSIFVGHG